MITKVEPEISLIEDGKGEWCVMKGRIRSPLSTWLDYEGFIKVYRHIVEKGVKDLYKIYKISGNDYVNSLRIVEPVSIGFAKDPRLLVNLMARSVVYYNAPSFQILNDIAHSDSVPLGLNPVLRDIVSETQNFLLDDGDPILVLREYVYAFIAKTNIWPIIFALFMGRMA